MILHQVHQVVCYTSIIHWTCWYQVTGSGTEWFSICTFNPTIKNGPQSSLHTSNIYRCYEVVIHYGKATEDHWNQRRPWIMEDTCWWWGCEKREQCLCTDKWGCTDFFISDCGERKREGRIGQLWLVGSYKVMWKASGMLRKSLPGGRALCADQKGWVLCGGRWE